MLVIEDLHVRYGKVPAVRGVSLSCRPGELVALLGSNGAGKSSTLLGIAGALDRGAVSGATSLDGVALSGRSPEEISRAGVVLVPERRRIFASLTVRENLLVGASGWASRREAEAETSDIFDRFPTLATMRDRSGGLLSGGQQQLLAIGRALMGRPKVLLLDEPSLGLAPATVGLVFAAINALRTDGLGVLLVEQNVRQARGIADRSLVMRKGKIEDNAEGLESLVSSYLGETVAKASP